MPIFYRLWFVSYMLSIYGLFLYGFLNHNIWLLLIPGPRGEPAATAAHGADRCGGHRRELRSLLQNRAVAERLGDGSQKEKDPKTCVYLYVFICIYMDLYGFICIYMYLYVFICKTIYTYICVSYIYICICVCIYCICKMYFYMYSIYLCFYLRDMYLTCIHMYL